MVRVVNALKLYQRPIDEEKNYATSRLQLALIDRRFKELNSQLEGLGPKQKEDALFSLAIDRLSSSISTSLQEDSTMFMIYVKDINPTLAAVTANAVARSYIIYDLQQQIADLQLKYGEKHASVVQLQNYVDNLIENLNGERLPDIEAMGPASVKIVEQAQIGVPVEAMSILFSSTVALCMSMFLGVLLSFIFDHLDQTFKTPHDVERSLNLPVLCSIPKRKFGKNFLSRTIT